MTDSQKFRLVLPDDWSEVNVYDIAGLIAATLEPHDGLEFSGIKQAAIEIEHEEQLRIAVECGNLVTRNRLTKIPEPFAIGEQLKRSVLSVEEFQEYVSQFGILVEIAAPGESLGRYNLEQAATRIAEATGESAKAMLKGLEEDVGNYKLPVHSPGSSATYRPTTVRTFYEEAYWDDLNEWLERTHRRLVWRFEEPTSKSHSTSATPYSTTINKIDKRVQWIKVNASTMFSDPQSIPEGGKSELRKFACANAKLFSESTFDAAWKKAKSLGYVEMADVEKYK